jgi:hypothetical protein
VHEWKKMGRPTKVASLQATSGKAAEETAKKLGTSRDKVEKALAVIAHAEETGDTSQLDAVREEKTSINKAAEKVRAKKGIKATDRNGRRAHDDPVPRRKSHRDAEAERYLKDIAAKTRISRSACFDNDALLRRALEPLLPLISEVIEESLTQDSETMIIGPTLNLAYKLLKLAPPERRSTCNNCGGKGKTPRGYGGTPGTCTSC